MSEMEGGLFFNIESLLNKDYRGVNIAVYGLATAGLALAIHKVRPVSKFSKAIKIPEHFIKQHEPLRGVYAGVQHSPVRVLVNHKAPIYLPLWHSSKPPLPVKIWGVDIVSGNAVNWLDCVAKGQRVTLKPITCENNELVSTVLLHLPQPKTKSEETLDIGQKLIELGFAKASLPQVIKKNSMEFKLAPALLSAENKAKSLRNGIWSDKLPPIPNYVAYWRKGSILSKELVMFFSKKMLEILYFLLKGTFVGVKTIVLKPFKTKPKSVQPT